ncbi:SNF2 family DNA or RNA helicase [Lachnospiraceae bacterium PF1-21]|uniref:DEAD/DEAH box helicase n=1 Tax=Ohessyouella blattaphilus TaxID=2949333 RepID=UPI003E1DCE01
MQCAWIRQGNHIAIQCGQETRQVNASSIYEALSTGDTFYIEGQVTAPIRNSFPDLYFSKIGSDIKCILNNGPDGAVTLNICCLRAGKEVELEIINGKILDQCIYKDEWFYVTGQIDELNELLTLAKIKTRTITISQYIELLRSNLLDAVIVNNVKTSLLDKKIDEKEATPRGVIAKLYSYQKTGYLWMKYMLSENGGCILGDEMGLGKTLQAITVMQYYKEKGKLPILVVAPVSLLQNWKRECNKFAPDLKILIHHGSKRTGIYTHLKDFDVIILSYNSAVSDSSLLGMIKWQIVILDEAQNIKNPNSNRAKYVKRIPRNAGIAITGTPFENHVLDIWSIVDFVLPGLLGSKSEYEKYISDDVEGGEKIEPILSPIMIRRNVADVAGELPEKVIIPQALEMSDEEITKYEEYRREALKESKKGAVGIGILQKLRIFCTHPAIGKKNIDFEPYYSSIKYQRMCEIVEEIISHDEKIILFTSYTGMFDILERDVPQRFEVPFYKINGSTPVEKRQGIIDEFSQINGSAFLALNPRAAGTGLNITAANHVIHYNLEWNPAIEDQASARAYRRGQTKTVFIYRLFYEDTVEQIVNERIEMKREISDAAIVGTSGDKKSSEDIISALNITPRRN